MKCIDSCRFHPDAAITLKCIEFKAGMIDGNPFVYVDIFR